jgi:hypothetical protein
MLYSVLPFRKRPFLYPIGEAKAPHTTSGAVAYSSCALALPEHSKNKAVTASANLPHPPPPNVMMLLQETSTFQKAADEQSNDNSGCAPAYQMRNVSQVVHSFDRPPNHNSKTTRDSSGREGISVAFYDHHKDPMRVESYEPFVVSSKDPRSVVERNPILFHQKRRRDGKISKWAETAHLVRRSRAVELRHAPNGSCGSHFRMDER